MKHLSDSSLIQNGLKQGGALSPLLFNFALEHSIRKVQENQVGLKLNGTHQLLAYTDDVNLLRDNIDTKLTKFRERTSDRRLSAKLVPPFVERVESRGQRGGSYGRILGFLNRSQYCFFRVAPQG
jgi:hypothetical protein